MANEVFVSMSLKAGKNGAEFTVSEKRIDTANVTFGDGSTRDAWITGVVQTSTNGVQLELGDVNYTGWIYIKNLGTTPGRYVDVRKTNTADDTLCRVYAGQACIFWGQPASLFVTANAGTPWFEYIVIEYGEAI